MAAAALGLVVKADAPDASVPMASKPFALESVRRHETSQRRLKEELTAVAEAAAGKAAFRALPLPAPGQDVRPLESMMGPIGQSHHSVGPLRKRTPTKGPAPHRQMCDPTSAQHEGDDEDEDGGLFLLTGIGEEAAAAAAPVAPIDASHEDGAVAAGPRTMELTAHGYGTGVGGADDDHLPLMLRMVPPPSLLPSTLAPPY